MTTCSFSYGIFEFLGSDGYHGYISLSAGDGHASATALREA